MPHKQHHKCPAAKLQSLFIPLKKID